MSRIISIGTAVPQHSTKQSEILEFMHAAYGDETASRKLNVLFNHSGIGTRYSAIPDFDKSRGDHIFFNGTPSTANVSDRLSVFKEKVIPLSLSAIHNAFDKIGVTPEKFGITHLITVTCTGIYAPGIDAALMEELNLPADIFRTSVNFMGCNAAFHALKIADMITKTELNARVLIVSVELCTLHFQPKNDHDNLLSNTIFGDGAAAVIVTSDSDQYSIKSGGLRISGFYSLLLNKGKDLMGWNVTTRNFEMILDARIPEFIGEEVGNLMLNAGKRFGISPDQIHHWAIHPGGKKI
ncbi:MAG: type III polyketide synthase, partial [Bacteroidota bacterium]|nr:type III polyketide synthase [Bacteroidota bacterium]